MLNLSQAVVDNLSRAECSPSDDHRSGRAVGWCQGAPENYQRFPASQSEPCRPTDDAGEGTGSDHQRLERGVSECRPYTRQQGTHYRPPGQAARHAASGDHPGPVRGARLPSDGRYAGPGPDVGTAAWRQGCKDRSAHPPGGQEHPPGHQASQVLHRLYHSTLPDAGQKARRVSLAQEGGGRETTPFPLF